MSDAATLFSRSKLIIDTNILLLLIVGSCDPRFISRFKRTRQFDANHFRVLRGVVDRFAELSTTAHILTEVSNLIGAAHGKHLLALRNALRIFVERATEDEITCRALVRQAVFPPLGITDSAITAIADETCVVLTDDVGLLVQLHRVPKTLGVNFYHLMTV